MKKTGLIISATLLLLGGWGVPSFEQPDWLQSRAAGIPQIPTQTKRYALVVGNGAYAQSPLANPVNDAKAMAAKLRGLGFEVIEKTNVVSNRDFRALLDQFQERLEANSVALVFYAGHGIQVDGHNYLIPTQAKIAKESDARYEALDVDDLILVMQQKKTRLNVLILDACRNNPYERSFRSGNGRGLAIVGAPIPGTLIAYATAANKTASDGEGQNGLYTQELLKALNAPGQSLEQVFKQVRMNVAAQSKNQQIPAEYSYVTEDFYFLEPGSAPVPLPLATTRPTAQPLRVPVSVPTQNPELQDTPQPEQSLPETVTNSLGMEFKLIPAGSFIMGDSHHNVTLTQPFYIQSTEVTQAMWINVMGQNPSHFKNPKRPVENVSWNDVQMFIQKLNQRGEGVYRLPTEAEWEYAARAGTTAHYACGDSDECVKDMGWVGDFGGNSDWQTHPVALKRPNDWGLYDMHGNVWEWVQDWYGDYPTGSVTDPQGPGSGSNRVFRGGGWINNAQGARSAFRIGVSPGGRYYDLGFRLVHRP